jgi:hypothetical protein
MSSCIKLLEENRKKLHNLEFSNDFLDITTKDKSDKVKIANFCTTKDIINRMDENICKSHI